MKLLFRLSWTLLFALTISSCGIFRRVVKCNPKTYNISAIEKNVQRQFTAAIEELKKGEPSILLLAKEATLKLAVSSALSVDGSLEVLIVQGSYKAVRTKSSSITFSYKDTVVKAGGAAIQGDVATIKDLIIKGAREFYTLSNIGTMKKDNFEIEISFSVQETTGGGFKFKVWGAEASTTAEKDCSVEQTLTLTFGLQGK